MRIRIVPALLLVTACGFGDETSPVGASDPPPSADAQTWLDAHNTVRQDAQPPPPAPLPALTWSSAAASVAQAWADRCSYAHNAGRGTRGENIAADAPPGTLNASSVVSAWAGEASDYNHASNTCAPGKDCGHYTQIVWRDTVRVGCAHRTCTTNSPFGAQYPNWEFWVCDYEPPGNVIGQKPY